MVRQVDVKEKLLKILDANTELRVKNIANIIRNVIENRGNNRIIY